MNGPKKTPQDEEAEFGPQTVPRPTVTTNQPTRPSPAVLAGSRHEPTDPPPPRAPWVPHDLGPEVQPLSVPKILVIDDNEDHRVSLKMALEGEGYRVIEAEDGVEGLKRVLQMERGRIPVADLIMLDLDMPRMPGLEFLEFFQLTTLAEIPLVILSGWRPPPGTIDDRFAFIGKGNDPVAMLTTVRKHVEENRARRFGAPR